MRKSSVIDWDRARLEKFHLSEKHAKMTYRAPRLSGGAFTQYVEKVDTLLVSPHYDLLGALEALRPIVCRFMRWPAETDEELESVRVTGIEVDWVSDVDYYVAFRFIYRPPIGGEMELTRSVFLWRSGGLVNSLLDGEREDVERLLDEILAYAARTKTGRADFFDNMPAEASIEPN